MYLKSIEIHGFKSFADRIKLDFLNGITGIVGPNGSGKSNVADAVRWVLGEQSARQLRGSSMQDVIFSGTEIRKPMGYAYVAISIDNSDRALSADFDEVTVTRRVYRSGESDYLINGNECRLKDINELFYDTGIGKEGYSIIGQGQIDKILSGRPEDRRELFDEAAGIVKFKKRKDTALKRLESEKNNLVRVNDILSEVERQVGPLEKQSEAAKEYLKKKEELKTLDANVFVLESKRYEDQIKDLDEKYSIIEKDSAEVDAQIEQSRQRYDEMGKQVTALEQLIADMRNELSNSSVQKGKIDAQIQVLKEQINSIRTSDQNFSERIKAVKKSLADHENDLEVLKKTRDEIEAKLSQIEGSGADNKTALEEFDKKIAELNEKIASKKQLVVDTIEARGEIKGNLERLKTIEEQTLLKKAELNSRLLKTKSDEESQNETISAFEKELEELSESIRKTDEEIASVNEETGKVRKLLEEADMKERQLDGQYRENKTKLETLKNIAERYEGYGNAVRVVMGQKSSVPGINGVVADIIKVEDKYENAIETALGANMQNVVVKDEQTAKKLIGYLKSEKAGRVTFLPLSSIQKREFNAPEALNRPGVIGMADTLVNVEKQYVKVAQNLLGNFIVVDDIDNAIKLAAEFRYTLRIVTLAGEALNPGGSISGGSFRNRSNFLGRKREIEQLEAAGKELLKEKDKVLALIEETRDKRGQLRQKAEDLSEKMQNEQIKLNTVKINLDAANEKKQDALSGSYGISKEGAELEKQLAGIGEDRKKYEEELLLSEKTEKEADEEAIMLAAELEKLENESSQLRQSVNENSMKSAQFTQQLAFSKENIDRVEGERLRLGEELSAIEANMEKNAVDIRLKDEQIKELMLTLETADDVNDKKSEELKQKEKEKEELTKVQQKIFFERDEISSKKVGLDKEKYRLETLKEKATASSAGLAQYMWDEYELTLIGCREFVNEELGSLSDMKQNTVRIKAQIRQLGDVNVNAIEEYRELMERYTFLSGQRDDIIKAEEDLRNIIADLDEAMKKQFTEQFAEIQRQFNEVFVELFGGGKGTLELVDEQDVLEAGIMITAQPPGKKLQNMMQLSGGEKALTAIALLFAIQNMKPSPFCLLDEIEAALDEANVERFAKYLQKLTEHTQFIVITHRRGTMVKADRLYGITMQEKGVSTQVAVDLSDETYK
ncbi:MAG: chromosome segregation protein SMC [Lachnospiraceae bacterium]|nr:chromosome segregation protein SMC [Lachnospiraceae bacterium]